MTQTHSCNYAKTRGDSRYSMPLIHEIMGGTNWSACWLICNAKLSSLLYIRGTHLPPPFPDICDLLCAGHTRRSTDASIYDHTEVSFESYLYGYSELSGRSLKQGGLQHLQWTFYGMMLHILYDQRIRGPGGRPALAPDAGTICRRLWLHCIVLEDKPKKPKVHWQMCSCSA